jgi:hypothetical protein
MARTTSDADELITTAKAAEMVGCTPPTLITRHYRGEIPAQRVGHVLVFRRADVEAFARVFTRRGGRRRRQSQAALA